MVAKLVLDEISSSGSNITIDATKTFTVNGSLLSAGSTNILYKTINHPIVEADVSGKSELIVTTTPGSPRDITLPLVSVTGADTCIITVVVSLDATGTQSVRVMNGANEAWTGYQNGDFVKFCVSNGIWQVLDHKETYYSSRYLAADLSIAAAANTKLITWTNISEIGNTWDNTNNKLVTPTGMNGYWTIHYNMASNSTSYFQVVPYLVIGGTTVIKFNVHATWDQAYMGQGGPNVSGHYYATTTEAVEFYGSNTMPNSGYSAGYVVAGGALSETHFTAQFNRVY
jgi:hypothetical protein